MQISFTVTAKLISAFVFTTWIVYFLFFLNPKFPASCHLLCLYRLVCVGLGQKRKLLVFSPTGSNEFVWRNELGLKAHLKNRRSPSLTTQPLVNSYKPGTPFMGHGSSVDHMRHRITWRPNLGYSILSAKRNFIEKLNKVLKSHLKFLKMTVDSPH